MNEKEVEDVEELVVPGENAFLSTTHLLHKHLIRTIEGILFHIVPSIKPSNTTSFLCFTGEIAHSSDIDGELDNYDEMKPFLVNGRNGHEGVDRDKNRDKGRDKGREEENVSSCADKNANTNDRKNRKENCNNNGNKYNNNSTNVSNPKDSSRSADEIFSNKFILNSPILPRIFASSSSSFSSFFSISKSSQRNKSSHSTTNNDNDYYYNSNDNNSNINDSNNGNKSMNNNNLDNNNSSNSYSRIEIEKSRLSLRKGHVPLCRALASLAVCVLYIGLLAGAVMKLCVVLSHVLGVGGSTVGATLVALGSEVRTMGLFRRGWSGVA